MFRFATLGLPASLWAAAKLAALMGAGAVVGFCAAPSAVVFFEGYDHGHQTEEYSLYTTPTGAVLGLLVHVWLAMRRSPPTSLPIS